MELSIFIVLYLLCYSQSTFKRKSIWNRNIAPSRLMVMPCCYADSNWPLQQFAGNLWVKAYLYVLQQHTTILKMTYILYKDALSVSPRWITLIRPRILSPSELLFHIAAVNSSFNMTHTCHLGVVGDSHAADVVVGRCRDLSGASCAVTGDGEKQRKCLRRFAWIYMNLQRVYCELRPSYDFTD